MKITYINSRKEKSVENITERGADEQTFPLIQDGGTIQITVEDYFKKKNQVLK